MKAKGLLFLTPLPFYNNFDVILYETLDLLWRYHNSQFPFLYLGFF